MRRTILATAVAAVALFLSAVPARASDAPVANDDSYFLPQNGSVSIAAPGVLANDVGEVTVSSFTAPSHGTASVASDGTFSYTPTAGFAGADQLGYTVSDGVQSASGYVHLYVFNDPPTAVGDAYDVLGPSAPLAVSAPGVLANDFEPNGDAMHAAIVAGPSHGSVTLNLDGSFTYTPSAGFVGADSFAYAAIDSAGAASTPATASVDVRDGAPTATDRGFSAVSGTTLVVGAPGVLAGASDPDGDALTAVLNAGPSHGLLALGSDGSFSYTPESGFIGGDSFTFVAGDGWTTSSVHTASINVAQADQPPVAAPDAYKALKNAALTVSAPGVLANDTDPNGDAMTAVKVTGPAHGTLSLNANGSFVYTPAQGFSGTDSFTYKVLANGRYSNTVKVTLNVIAPKK